MRLLIFVLLACLVSCSSSAQVENTEKSPAVPLPPRSTVWHSGLNQADLVTSGLVASLSVSGTGGSSTECGSTDGSYGSFEADAPDAGGAFELHEGEFLEITLTNDSGRKVLLEHLRIDAGRHRPDSPKDVAVTYASGDLDDEATTLGEISAIPVASADLADYQDLDCELRQLLADTLLDAGESAVFRIAASDASGTDATYVDNIAICVDMSDYLARPPAKSVTLPDGMRPNVVIFYADDVGQGDISAYGFGETTKLATPNIDALASCGMRFTNAHTVYGTCAPSRYGILSGNLALRGRRFNGTWQSHFSSQFLDGQRSLGDLFQSAGYRTAFFGKTHLGGRFYLPDGSIFSDDTWSADLLGLDWPRGFHRGPTALGFDYSFLSHDGIQGPPYVYFENDKPIDGLTYDRGQKMWSWSAATEAPYAFLQKDRPSEPGYIPTDSDGNGVHGKVELDNGTNSTVGYAYWDSTKTGELYSQAARDFLDDQVANHPNQPFYMHYCSQCVHIPHTPDTFFEEPVRGTELTPHMDMLHEMDLQFKALVDKLEEKGLADNTIVIFTSDNGGLNASKKVGHETSGRFRGAKGDTHEGGHRVPFIIRWGDGVPGNSFVPPGTVCEQVISQTDLFASFAALLDRPLDATQALDSINVLPYFTGRFTPVIRDHLIAARKDYAFHLGGWKIIASCEKAAPYAPLAVLEMYHLASDPYEEIDLSTDPTYAAMKDRMLAELTAKVLAPRSTNMPDSKTTNN